METSVIPGDFVRHPSQSDWGIGQIQSVIGNRITVNFENAGKKMIFANNVELEIIHRDELPGL